MANDRANCTRCSGCRSYVAHETYRNACKNCRCSMESHSRLSTTNSGVRCAGNVSAFEQLDRAIDQLLDCGGGEGRAVMTLAQWPAGAVSVSDFAWTPDAAGFDVVLRYFSCLPADKVPLVGSQGERHRLEQLERQLPPHDGAACFRATSVGTAEERSEHKSFCDRRAAEAAGRGRVLVMPPGSHANSCKRCDRGLTTGEVVVRAAASNLGLDAYWHPACFVCRTCNELLVDLNFFTHVGGEEAEMYCGRHHAERLKPRCAACDEIIFADECTEAEDRCWHITHFCCFECGAQLGGCRYVMRDDRPYCCPCFERRFADVCSTCHSRIGVVQGHMVHGDTHWHATPECFCCRFCAKNLMGEAFLPKADGAIFCSAWCCEAAAAAAQPTAEIKAHENKGDEPAALPHSQQQVAYERWTEDAGSRLQSGENFSEGYGSLRNCQSLLRRSLPDVTAASAAESSDDEDEEHAGATSRLTNRRGSDKSAASFRQQRRLAFELRRSRRKRPDGGKSKVSASVAGKCTTPAERVISNPDSVIRQRPPAGSSCSLVAPLPVFAKHLEYSALDMPTYDAPPQVRRPPRMGNFLPVQHAHAKAQQQPQEQLRRVSIDNSRCYAVVPQASLPSKPSSASLPNPSEDDDGYQEGCRCHHSDGVCPLCTSGSSSSSSDGEDAAYEQEVERSRGLRVARDLSRRASLPQKMLSRQVSAKVVQTVAKTAKQRRTRNGNCSIQ